MGKAVIGRRMIINKTALHVKRDVGMITNLCHPCHSIIKRKRTMSNKIKFIDKIILNIMCMCISLGVCGLLFYLVINYMSNLNK